MVFCGAEDHERISASAGREKIARSRSVTGGLTNGSPGHPVSTRQVTDLASSLSEKEFWTQIFRIFTDLSVILA